MKVRQLNIFEEYEKTHQKIWLYPGRNHRYLNTPGISPNWIYVLKWGQYTESYYSPLPPITQNHKPWKWYKIEKTWYKIEKTWYKIEKTWYKIENDTKLKKNDTKLKQIN